MYRKFWINTKVRAEALQEKKVDNEQDMNGNTLKLIKKKFDNEQEINGNNLKLIKHEPKYIANTLERSIERLPGTTSPL